MTYIYVCSKADRRASLI